MKSNVGTLDSLIRIGSAVLIGVLIISHTITGTVALVFGILTLILLITAVVGICPLYMLFHISTRSKKKVKH